MLFYDLQVDQKFAECLSLPDRTIVQLKVASAFPKAEFVTIEPSSEDDWEILELNSELAEEVILKQVRNSGSLFLSSDDQIGSHSLHLF